MQTLSTWRVVNATSYISARSASTAVTTSYTGPAAGTVPGAITIEGILVLLNYRSNSPSGTFSVQLFNHTGAAYVAGTLVTINVSDLPRSSTSGIALGWVYMKFASPVTLTAGQSYSARLTTSVASQVFAWRTASANTWIQGLVTNASPGSFVNSDNFIITGTNTSAGVSTTATVTMNQTGVNPIWGLSTTGFENYVGQGGQLVFGTSAGVNYRLPLTGNLIVCQDSLLTMGTQANPIPASSSALIDITCTSSGQFALFIEGGNVEFCGATKKTWTLLAADVAAGATASTTTVATSWLNGDSIVFPPTTRTATQSDAVTMNANASGTTITHNALTNAHGGNAATLVQGEVGNLTKNVTFGAGNSSFPPYIFYRGYESSFTARYTAFSDIGTTSIGSAGLAIQPVAGDLGDVLIDECVFRRTTLATGFYAISFNTSNSNINSFSLTNSLIHQYGTGVYWLYFATSVITNPSSAPKIEDCLINRPFNAGIITTEPQMILRRNRIAGCNDYAFYTGATPLTTGPLAWGEKLDNVAHSNASYGFNMADKHSIGGITCLWQGSIAWRNATAGWLFNGVYSSSPDDFVHTGSVGFGNSYQIYYNACSADITIKNSYFYGGTTLVSTALITPLSGASNSMGRFTDCYFGYDQSLVLSPYSSAVYLTNANTRAMSIVATDCIYGGTEALFTSGLGGLYDGRLGLVSLKHNGVTGSHKVFNQTGYYQTDTSIYKTASPSIRMASIIANIDLNSNIYRIPVNSGTTCQVSVWVRKSTTSDSGGVNYNGNQPKLMYRYNALAGNLTTLAAATMTASLGVWEQLTYTTATIPDSTVLEFYIECDGTAGWINIDDWSSTTSNDSRGLEYFGVPGSYAEIDYNTSGGSSEHSYTFIS
jgi:hypothetical protein